MSEISVPHRSVTAGTIRRIRLENFMCHSSLQIEFCDYVNFITGQNGSGKSAILTALCVAFGCRAKSTQRGSTLKDFIKTGCSYASVMVEVKNEGDDAFKPEIYGDTIIVERRITDSSSTTVLKDEQGKKVSSRKEELRELVEHFNIDVENPCVIMTQDKSREFLHTGNAKDKFKFFFKATLLQQVDELLQNIGEHLESANELVHDLEKSIEPIVKELSELQEKIKNMEHIEELSVRIKELKKKLAWSWVYDVDNKLEEKVALIEKLRERKPACEAKINKHLAKMEDLKDCFATKRDQYAHLGERNSEVTRTRNELEQSLSMATKHMLELEDEHLRKMNDIQKLMKNVKAIEQQVHDIEERNLQNTQAEEGEMQEKIEGLQHEVDAANSLLIRFKEEENTFFDRISSAMNEIRSIIDEIKEYEKKERDISVSIRELRQHQANKVTAFGGERVIELLRLIELHHRRFRRPPIGPIGAHLTLSHGDMWACAVENAVGMLFNAFIVTDHKDFQILRSCAQEARYDRLQIVIYDFSIKRYNIPADRIPQTRHPTTLSVLHSDNPTVINVLVDKGGAERQVLVKDYDVGKIVAFDERIPNLKEVFTKEGYRMFSRGSVQTVLPPNKRARTGRLCQSYDDHIEELQREASYMQEQVQQARRRKRDAEEKLHHLQDGLQSAKRRRQHAERDFGSKKLALDDIKHSYAAEAATPQGSSVDELCEEISRIQGEIQRKEDLLRELRGKVDDSRAKVGDYKGSLAKLLESANEDIDAFNKAEQELERIQREINTAEKDRSHYEKILNEKVLPDIRNAEAEYEELELKRKESYERASCICPESEVEALGGCSKDSRPEQLSAQLDRLNQRFRHASQKYTEPIDDLKMLYEKKQRKIMKKQKTYEDFRQRLAACNEALTLRRNKFLRNAALLKRQLIWQFNGHLRKKGITGRIKVSYEEKTLLIEVKMPQDSSSTAVRDTRGLSGGERSFSTLCFALALHEMTEAPFRAMDEFDVFMDAVSRKISLDTLVEFALSQGSQWIFITPHDISMVKNHDRVKKQQMAPPRS